MLHICRQYLPDKVYLYLSGEMCEEHEKNDPYLYCIHQLEEHTDHHIETEVILRPDLTEVQVFDSFVEEFRSILKTIRQQEEAGQILVNVSSGTPAMKSSLLMLSVLSEGNYLPIQVATPERKMNPRDVDWRSIGKEEKWELNFDNLPDHEDRTSIASSQNWASEIKKEVIQRHLEAYNYVAALQVADDMTDFDPVCRELIHAAVCRLRLDFKGMGKLAASPEYSSAYIPVRESNYRILVEYALSLLIRLKKHEYADFLRALSPLLFDFYKLILKDEYGIDIDKQYTYQKRTGELYWDRNKLSAAPEILHILEMEYEDRGGFHFGSVANSHLTTLILGMTENGFLKKKIDLLKKVESELRNMAAHQMVSITRETVKETVDVWPEQIMDAIREVLDRYIIKNRDHVWDSYDTMNQMILRTLK